MKSIYKKMILLVLLPTALDMANSVYNAFVPVLLQTGHPGFASAGAGAGFALSAAQAGVFISIGSAAKIAAAPLAAMISDNRTGPRRRGFVLSLFIPIVLMALMSIPWLPMLYAKDGSQLYLWLFGGAMLLISGSFTVCSMALILMRWDVTPPGERGMSQSVFMIIASVGAFVALSVGGKLFTVFQPLPFILISINIAAMWFVTFRLYKEPETKAASAQRVRFRMILTISPHELKPVLLRLASTAALYGARMVFAVYFISYLINSADIGVETASMLYSLNAAVSLAVAYPVGKLSERYPCEMIVLCGVLAAIFAFVPLLFMSNIAVVIMAMIVGNGGLSAAGMMAPPMIANSAPHENTIGLFTSMDALTGALGMMLSPVLAGFVVDRTGSYSMVWTVLILFGALSACMLLISGKSRASAEIG